jgi:hypothetical protein
MGLDETAWEADTMTPTPITRDTVQARLRQSREALSGSIAGLTEAELQNLRVTPE